MPTIEYEELKKILPHAYPFVLIDRVLDYKEGESLVAVKNITSNEWPNAHQQEHYPETLLIEAAAQAALVLYHVTKVKDSPHKPRYAIGKVLVEFFRPVNIGSSVQFSAKMQKVVSFGGLANCVISGQGSAVGELNLFYSVRT
ncbi:MAG: 3-hydroxyacyl-[acyl-carrier-protein] dehydratase FabZ [Candidatus Omnitrophota bacterium]|nr:3-hydroxyacyl-[acyl-carrier-protein] dehydratase FabZ [Candidatus Omnitrophota bacterium]